MSAMTLYQVLGICSSESRYLIVSAMILPQG